MQTGARAPQWDGIDTVLIDMDGTLLDLGFDNWFWQEHLPALWAAARGLGEVAARCELKTRFDAARGRLDWYCIDFWSRELGLDVRALTQAARARVRWLPGTAGFLERLARRGKKRVLLTDAHPATLAIKDSSARVVECVDAVYSSHDFGAPKEDPAFWSRFVAAQRLEPARTLLVDDSVAVLNAARDFGIGWLCEIRRPDSGRPTRAAAGFHGVESIAELG